MRRVSDAMLQPTYEGDVGKMESYFAKYGDAYLRTRLYETGDGHVHFAARGGNLNILKWLNQHGLDLHSKNIIGNTAILDAGLFGHKHVIEWLKSKGLDLWQRNEKGSSIVHHVVSGGHLDLLKWLYEQDPGCLEHRDVRGNCALQYAASKDYNEKVMDWLESHGLSSSCRNVKGNTLLHTAALNGRANAMEWSFMRGINVNTTNYLGQTPAHVAAKKGQCLALQWLSDHGAVLDTFDVNGLTPGGVALVNSQFSTRETIDRLKTEQRKEPKHHLWKEWRSSFKPVEARITQQKSAKTLQDDLVSVLIQQRITTTSEAQKYLSKNHMDHFTALVEMLGLGTLDLAEALSHRARVTLLQQDTPLTA